MSQPDGLAKLFRNPRDSDLYGQAPIGYHPDSCLPVIGAGKSPLLLKQHELDELPRAAQFRCQLFNLAVPEDRQAYTEIMDNYVNGRFMIKDSRHMGVKDDYPMIWLEWVQLFVMAPNRSSPAVAGVNLPGV